MNEEELLKLVDNLKIWKKNNQIAPHKPLLILLALGQIKKGEPRLLAYKEIYNKLSYLLKRYGLNRGSYHPEEPFVRLVHDGIWELFSLVELDYKNPSNHFLINNNVYGGFTSEVYSLLKDNDQLLNKVASNLLNKYFSKEKHVSILVDVGLQFPMEVMSLDKSEFELEQEHLDDTIAHIKDKTYYVWEIIDKKKDLIKNGINTSGDDIALNSSQKEINTLNDAMKEPYFGRIDTDSEEFGNETFYIGKQGVKNLQEEIVVVDWRMPIASVYYNFTPGKPKQHYSVVDKDNNKEIFILNVLRKREFTIKDSKLIKIVQQVAEVNSDLNKTITDKGTEITVTDEFLKEILENSETTGFLKEIIATIQYEQNIAIRQPLDKNVIIQGVAGSGKSSIALHRISFLLYNNKNLKPEDILIIGPSNMFISSFKGLLPELDLEGINQSTFQLLALKYLRPFIKNKINSNYSYFFENVLFGDNPTIERKRIEFKGSKLLASLINSFIQEFTNSFTNRMRPISIFDRTLFTEDLIEIFNGYKYLPFTQRVEKFIEHVSNYFKDQLNIKINDLNSQYEFFKGTFIKGGGLSPQVERNLINQIKEVLNYKKNKLEKEYIDEINNFKKKMFIPDPLSLYKQILNYDLLQSFSDEIGREYTEAFKGCEIKDINYFDLPPILYIYFLLYDTPKKYSHLVVDEAQDFSYIHFLVLKNITKTMTILGDKDQSIFLKYGQENWDQIRELIFESGEETILELNNSYRSTKEIIQVANNVLENYYGNKHNSIIPINRSGPQVGIENVNNGEDLLNKINTTISEWKDKYKRIAIIHKDENKAKKLSDYLNHEFENSVIYINPEEDVKDGFISVLASYNSKGMEFDGVILVNINEEFFPKDDLHVRLLYVLLTRAQHEVKIFYQDKYSPLLEGANNSIIKKSSKFDDIL